MEDAQRERDEELTDRDVGVVGGFGRAGRGTGDDARRRGDAYSGAASRQADEFDLGDGDGGASLGRSRGSHGSFTESGSEAASIGSAVGGSRKDSALDQLSLPPALPTDAEVLERGTASTGRGGTERLDLDWDPWSSGRRISRCAALTRG